MGSLPNGQIAFFRLHLPTTGDFAILNKTVFTASYAAPLDRPARLCWRVCQRRREAAFILSLTGSVGFAT